MQVTRSVLRARGSLEKRPAAAPRAWIVAALGAGGMGEVFRAVDRRLDRQVAIKIFPAEFRDDAQLRLRLDREARVISSLSHPHICTIHDVGHEEGIDYLVLERLEGETVAARLLKGPDAGSQVIRYGIASPPM